MIKTHQTGGGPKIAEEYDGETTFSPTNTSKEHLNAQKIPQNYFWMPAEDMTHPEKKLFSSKGGKRKYKRQKERQNW